MSKLKKFKPPKYFKIKRKRINKIYKFLWYFNDRILTYSTSRYKKESHIKVRSKCYSCPYKKVCIDKSSHLICWKVSILNYLEYNKLIIKSNAIEFYLKKEV